MKTITVKDTEVTVLQINNEDYISLTDMIQAKDGDFFISDWLRNRNTLEYIGIWENVYNPDFNYGEFAIIKSQAGVRFLSERRQPLAFRFPVGTTCVQTVLEILVR